MTKHTMYYVFLITLMFTLMCAGPAFASSWTHGSYSATTDACAGCHVAHTAQAPKLLKLGPTQTQLCYLCHGSGAPGAPYDIQLGKSLMHKDKFDGTNDYAWIPSTAGGFEGILSGTTWSAAYQVYYSVSGSTYTPNTSRHNIWGYTSETGSLNSSDPSGDTFIPGGWATISGSGLVCSSCHDPHAGGPYPSVAANPRLLRTSVLGGAYTGLDTDFTLTWIGDYSTNDVAYRVSAYVYGSTNWCGSCHSKFNVGDNAGHTLNQGMYRHAMNQPVDTSHFVYAPGTPDIGTPTETYASNAIIACLTCHRAHASTASVEGWAASWPRSEGGTGSTSALLRMDNRGVCYNCHGAAQYNLP